jgi:hypothetical protein
LPHGAADLAYQIADYWYSRPDKMAILEVPEEYQTFLQSTATTS